MGMFDTVHWTCPKCKQHNETQSKAGPCQLLDFTLEHGLPVEIINDLDEGGGWLYCPPCDTSYRFTHAPVTSIQCWVSE